MFVEDVNWIVCSADVMELVGASCDAFMDMVE
jgi:hypothetical protein